VTIDDTLGLLHVNVSLDSKTKSNPCTSPRYHISSEVSFTWLMESSVCSFSMTTETEQDEDELEASPSFATCMILLKGVMSVVSRFVIKMIYVRHPELSVWQFLFVRSAACASLNLTITNVNTKRLLWDEIIEKKNVTSLLYSIVQGCLSIVISCGCLKYLPVTVVGISSQLSPIMVIFMAYFFLSEQISSVEIVAVIFSIVSACLVLIGNNESSSPKAVDAEFTNSTFF
jgi:drug/metabolite transporter (DMT)-like permease